MPDDVVEVAAAVIERPDGRFLMASRPAGKHYAGWWEFPGGKVEAGEEPRQALERELREELGIVVRQAWPWLQRGFVYPHARVMLRFFRVTDWEGTPHPHEGQSLAWVQAGQPGVEPILPANGPILKALRLPLEYAVSAVADLGEGLFLRRLEQRLGEGLGMLQLREKQLTRDAFALLVRQVADRCRQHGALLVLNDAPALAAELGLGLHLPSSRLMGLGQRPDLEWVGASCHNPAELARAADLMLDWVVLSPIRPTASHPEAQPLGWATLAAWVRDYPLPVFALGGLSPGDLTTARRHGAHGVALRGAAWRVSDRLLRP
ncbi:MAG TPA: Nudix family hydrolase [Thiobacillaceae bacterium]|nr:Nudix family hydrolase [Thiobacillaceae bacterium]HNU64794.1 Nudix family hydrolase [Thiobacillaceae bacterium]